MQHAAAWKWWRKQRIHNVGVPSNVVPRNWPIPVCSLSGRVFVPDKSIAVGPYFLAGDCTSSGQHVALPYLFFIAAFAFGLNLYDIYTKWSDSENTNRGSLDFIWLGLIACCNIAPFIAFRNLFETRRDLHVALKPLLASRSIGGGVKVAIVGSDTDPIVKSLRSFLTLIGHNADEASTIANDTTSKRASMHVEEVAMTQLNTAAPSDEAADMPARSSAHGSFDGLQDKTLGKVVTVYVMSTLEDRDQLFQEPFVFDKYSLFIWNGEGDPFTADAIGKRLMRFLVLVSAWDKKLLAENLFSAIGLKVVDLLHSGSTKSTFSGYSATPAFLQRQASQTVIPVSAIEAARAAAASNAAAVEAKL